MLFPCWDHSSLFDPKLGGTSVFRDELNNKNDHLYSF